MLENTGSQPAQFQSVVGTWTVSPLQDWVSTSATSRYLVLRDCLCACQVVCHIWLFVMPWTAARQTSLSIRFSWQEYWSALPCPPPEDLPYPGIKSKSLTSPALASGFFTSATREAHSCLHLWLISSWSQSFHSIKNTAHQPEVVQEMNWEAKALFLCFDKDSIEG